MKITVKRSTEYRNRLAIETGTSIPEDILIDVDPASFTPATKTLLVRDGAYPSFLSHLYFGADTIQYLHIDNEAENILPETIEAALLEEIGKIQAEEEKKRSERERKTLDQKRKEEREEAKKKQKEEFLKAWVATHGTKSQQDRLEEDLLDFSEIMDSIRETVFAPVTAPRYEKITIEDVCTCEDRDYSDCRLSCDVEAAPHLTAEQYEQYREMKTKLPDAKWQVRKHVCETDECEQSLSKLGVVATITVAPGITVSREFELA